MLRSLPKLFEGVTDPPQSVDTDVELDNETSEPPFEEGWARDSDALAKLQSFCGHEFKSAIVADVHCQGVLELASAQPALAGDDTNPANAKVLNCLTGKCRHCGFKKVLFNGLRPKLEQRTRRFDGKIVDDLRPHVPVEFQSKST